MRYKNFSSWLTLQRKNGVPRKELTPHGWDNRNANLYEGLYDLVFRKWSNHRLNIKGIKSCLCEDRPARTPHAISTLTIGCLGFMLCSFQSVKSFDNFQNALHITAARRQMCFLIKAIDNKGNRLPIYPSPKTRFYPRLELGVDVGFNRGGVNAGLRRLMLLWAMTLLSHWKQPY